MPKLVVGILLFEDYETLDAHGPIEFLCVPPTQDHFQIVTVAEKAELIASKQGVKCRADYSFDDCPTLDVLLVPGGRGSRAQSINPVLLRWIVQLYEHRERPLKYLLSVCTGSALLARAGVLDGKKATSNKLSWDWVIGQSEKTTWVKHARWVVDGNIITSAGVSAGMDMILFFIAKVLGEATAKQAAKFAEYNGQWRDPSDDPWGSPPLDTLAAAPLGEKLGPPS